VNTPRTLVALVAFGGITAASLSGCSVPGSDDAQFHVVATTTQVGDFVSHIVGDTADVQVHQLLQAGASPHAYDPSAADLLALGDADVIVENGLELESWLDDAVAASGATATIVDASESAYLIATGDEHAEDDEHDHSDEEEHAEEEHADDEEHTDEHDHDHGEFDPHVWHSAANAQIMVNTILDALVEADAAHADDYTANATEYLAALADLDTWIVDSIEQVDPSDRLLVTSHDAFGYYIDAYDLEFVGAIIPSLDDSAEASAAEIDELVALIRETGARAVFAESSVNPAAAETIADEAGITVYSGEEALYADSLGAAGSSGANYIASVVHNTQLIVESWGTTALPLPESLTASLPDVG